MDRFSRRRTIYLLDATSASLYLILALLIIFGFFSFPLLATMTFVIGIINSAYLVAFNSFYPMLVSDGNYSKAYSVSSTLETVSYVMQGIMRREDAVERLRFEKINNQIAFCTEAALRTLRFAESYHPEVTR